jgi:hypothetical protein
LYVSLKTAVVSETKVTMENEKFPVESDDKLLGGTLLLRKANKDLWRIFENEMLNNNTTTVMFIMGPSGVGKVFIINISYYFYLIVIFLRILIFLYRVGMVCTSWLTYLS